MELLVLVLIGGILALDQTSLGQFMLARPVVAAPLAGAILGAPETGLAVGLVLEVLFLPAFPVGGAKFPEVGPAGVVAATGAVLAGGGAAGMALGTALGAVWGLGGGWSIQLLRRLNDRFVPPGEGATVAPARIVMGHLAALGVDFLRGCALTAAGIGIATALGPRASGAWQPDLQATLLMIGAAAALSVGGLASGLGAWSKRRGPLALGAVIGLVLGLLA